MARDLKTVKDSIDAALKQGSSASFVTPADITLHVDNALIQVNQDRPFINVVDIAGDGTSDYALPAGFEKGFSHINQVEYPAGEQSPIIKRETDDYFEYEDPNLSPTLRLRFRTLSPLSTEIIRLTHTSSYILSTSVTNLDQVAYLSVIYKALGFIFSSLGSKFTQSNDPTIQADAVNYGAAGQNFIFIATQYDTKYKQVIGISKDVVAAGAFVETDIVFSHGEDLIWHPRRTR